MRKIKALPFLFAILFIGLVGNEAHAANYTNDQTCTGDFTSSVSCSGEQDFPDDGNQQLPVHVMTSDTPAQFSPFGIPGYPDSLYEHLTGDDVFTTTTPITILSYLYVADADSGQNVILCNGSVLGDYPDGASPEVGLSYRSYFEAQSEFSVISSSQYHCTGTISLDDMEGEDLWFQYVPYDTRSSTSTGQVVTIKGMDWTQLIITLGYGEALISFGIFLIVFRKL